MLCKRCDSDNEFKVLRVGRCKELFSVQSYVSRAPGGNGSTFKGTLSAYSIIFMSHQSVG
jgi:hypothetical protein